MHAPAFELERQIRWPIRPPAAWARAQWEDDLQDLANNVPAHLRSAVTRTILTTINNALDTAHSREQATGASNAHELARGAALDAFEAMQARIERHRPGLYPLDVDERQFAARMTGLARVALRERAKEPLQHFTQKHGVPGQSDLARQRRATDPKYWRRRYRRTVAREIEAATLTLDPTQVQWTSNTTHDAWQKRQERTQEWADSKVIQADDGTEIDVVNILASQQKRQYAELLARARGVATLAIQATYTEPRLLTITVPAHMHPTTTRNGKRQPNSDYDGTTPAQAHSWAQQRWARARATAFRRGREGYWILAAQPHKDGTPHYHVVIWSRPGDWEAVESILRRSFDATNGARGRIGLDVREIQVRGKADATGAALAYVARAVQYIARAGAEGDGTFSAAEADRTAAWASLWAIRRFRSSHTKATVWKMLRKPDLDIPEGTDEAQAQAAARSGDYAQFIEAAERAGLKPEYGTATNGYGETVARLFGVSAHNNGAVVYVPQRTWTIRSRDDSRDDCQAAMATVISNHQENPNTKPENQNHARHSLAKPGLQGGGVRFSLPLSTDHGGHAPTDPPSASERSSFSVFPSPDRDVVVPGSERLQAIRASAMAALREEHAAADSRAGGESGEKECTPHPLLADLEDRGLLPRYKAPPRAPFALDTRRWLRGLIALKTGRYDQCPAFLEPANDPRLTLRKRTASGTWS